jgi:hypothetical protein
MSGSTIASVIAIAIVVPVKYMTHKVAIIKCPIVYISVLNIVPELSSKKFKIENFIDCAFFLIPSRIIINS